MIGNDTDHTTDHHLSTQGGREMALATLCHIVQASIASLESRTEKNLDTLRKVAADCQAAYVAQHNLSADDINLAYRMLAKAAGTDSRVERRKTPRGKPH
jgi:hypothetical protein